ncbi:MAG TPA: pimeloyl-[acyl-carrier protein] methyl ester esterase [Gammaproteobacteria bacterium]|nr:pimeloyl-[acyl-carrier protein] methyl ester esterase [Gammaproteobacteria bacterium]
MLHTETGGQGPELVLVHGWGMHGGLLAGLARRLAERFRVTRVDLPGHGHSPPRLAADTDGLAIDAWLAALLQVVPERAIWVGWSLGGLIGLRAAAQVPRRVHRLVLLASSPRFVQAADWPDAVEPGVFDAFARQLADDAARTQGRFLALQVRGVDRGGDLLRRLRRELAARPQPQLWALAAGLDILRETDLRAVPATSPVPVSAVLGERDTLVPATLAGLPGLVSAHVIEGAGHAPFLSHEADCADAICRQLMSPPRAGERHV